MVSTTRRERFTVQPPSSEAVGASSLASERASETRLFHGIVRDAIPVRKSRTHARDCQSRRASRRFRLHRTSLPMTDGRMTIRHQRSSIPTTCDSRRRSTNRVTTNRVSWSAAAPGAPSPVRPSGVLSGRSFRAASAHRRRRRPQACPSAAARHGWNAWSRAVAEAAGPVVAYRIRWAVDRTWVR
jgi:hypothetical protein